MRSSLAERKSVGEEELGSGKTKESSAGRIEGSIPLTMARNWREEFSQLRANE